MSEADRKHSDQPSAAATSSDAGKGPSESLISQLSALATCPAPKTAASGSEGHSTKKKGGPLITEVQEGADSTCVAPEAGPAPSDVQVHGGRGLSWSLEELSSQLIVTVSLPNGVGCEEAQVHTYEGGTRARVCVPNCDDLVIAAAGYDYDRLVAKRRKKGTVLRLVCPSA